MRDAADAGRPGRIGLLDVLRGIALLAMVVFHFTWDLEFFGYLAPGTTNEGGWRLFARSIASSFLFLAGVSLVLAHGREIRWTPFLKRLGQVAAGAAAITAATFVATPDGFVYFGILHQIAFASLVGLAFVRLPFWLTLAAALAVLLLPDSAGTPLADTRWVAWTGLAESPPLSNDFVPVFPWTSAVLLGIAASRLVADRGWWARLGRLNAGLQPAWPLALIGRHSLAFYLLHQPVLIGLVAGYAQVVPPDERAAFAQSCRGTCTEDRDAAFCERYCGCVQAELEAQDLLAKLLRGTQSAEEGETVRASVRSCSFAAQQ